MKKMTKKLQMSSLPTTKRVLVDMTLEEIEGAFHKQEIAKSKLIEKVKKLEAENVELKCAVKTFVQRLVRYNKELKPISHRLDWMMHLDESERKRYMKGLAESPIFGLGLATVAALIVDDFDKWNADETLKKFFAEDNFENSN